jgi:hypothetical protein
MDKVGNDSISSIFVDKGYTAQLCQHEGDGEGDGVCWDFTGRQNVPEEFDNQASFIWVRRKP